MIPQIAGRCKGKPYDRTYSSKVFTFTKPDPYLPKDAILGGTGYLQVPASSCLQDEIENAHPDYTLYPHYPHALGFITRGCPRNCDWCIVPKKEGAIRYYRHPSDIIRGRASAVFMDNNILALDEHIKILDYLAKLGRPIDFNQGLDARLVTGSNAPLLAEIKWMPYIRFSCDTPTALPHVERAAALIRAHGYKDAQSHGGEIFCYLLVRDVTQAHATAERLRKMNISPFAQAYIGYDGTDNRTQEQRDFCRWVNHKAIFKTVKWEDYNP